MLQIRIRHYIFSLTPRFAEGHPLSAGEAQALNGLFAENVRNNIDRLVLRAIAELPEGQLLSQETMTGLQTEITRYELAYQFVPKHVPKPRLGTIEAEILRLATLQAHESTGDSAPEGEIERLQANPTIIALARANVASRDSIAASALDELK